MLRAAVYLSLLGLLLGGCDGDAPVDASLDDASTGLDAGGGPRDSGTTRDAASDAGTADAGEDAGPPIGCAGIDALFCEDFEDLAEGPAASGRWTTEGSGTLTIDSEHARGARAVHVHTDENGSAFLRLAFTPPGDSYFGRMYLWVTAFPSAPDWAHYTLVEQTGEGAGRIRPVGGQYVPFEGGAFWGIGSDGGPTGDWTDWRTSAPSEAGRWVCVEWEMDDAEAFIRLTLDGVPNDDLTVDRRHHGGADVDLVFPRFDSLRVGWQLYQGGPTPSQFDLWIDDLVLATERVGC